MAFGGSRLSCVRPGTHSTRHQDSHNDWTPCRMAWPCVSAGAHAPHSDETPDPNAFVGGVALRSSLTLPRFPGLLLRRSGARSMRTSRPSPRLVLTRPPHGADTMISACFTISMPSVCSMPAKGEKPGAWPNLPMRSRLMVPVPGTAARSVWICRQATRLACVSICPGRRSPSMSFTSFSSSTGRLTQCVAKKSKGPRSGGVHAISGSRTSTLGVTARKPVCGTQAPKPQDTPWLPVPGDVTRALPQRSERGAGQAAPRQIVQLGAPLPPGADQSGGQDA